MYLICSYCNVELGEKEPYDNEKVTHGMCDRCYSIIVKQLNGLSFDEYLDDFDIPVMIIDSHSRVFAANKHVQYIMDKPLSDIKGFLGGNAMECAFARLPGGCGKTVHCSACTIRNLVDSTRINKFDYNNQIVFLKQSDQILQMEVSTNYVNGVVSIIIHNINVC